MLTNVLIALIRVYQLTLSPVLLALFGPVCRFEPSCSRYAAACLEGHGPFRGTLLSLKRLCKCHPFHPGGFDPPPPPRSRRFTTASRWGRERPHTPGSCGAHSARSAEPASDSTRRDLRAEGQGEALTTVAVAAVAVGASRPPERIHGTR